MAFYLQINLKERAGTPTRPFQIMFQRGLSDDNLCGNFVLVVLHGHDVEAGSEIVAEALCAVALDFACHDRLTEDVVNHHAVFAVVAVFNDDFILGVPDLNIDSRVGVIVNA